MSWSQSRKEQPDVVWKQRPTQKGLKNWGLQTFSPSAILKKKTNNKPSSGFVYFTQRQSDNWIRSAAYFAISSFTSVVGSPKLVPAL